MSFKRTKGKETRKSRPIVSSKAVASSRNVARLGRGTVPKLAVKTTLKAPAKTAIIGNGCQRRSRGESEFGNGKPVIPYFLRLSFSSLLTCRN